MKRLAIVVMAAAVALPGWAARAEDVLVRAPRVYTMTGPPLEPGAVLVSGGKIKQVGKDIAAPEGARVIDLKEGALMPGLVDAYSQEGVAGGPSELTREVSPEYRVLAAVDWKARAFREALDGGTTTLGLAPGTDGVFAGLSCVVKTAGEKDGRVVVRDGALVITAASDPRDRNRARSRPDSIYVRQPTNRMGVIWILRSTFNRAREKDRPEFAAVRQALAGERRVLAVSRTEQDLVGLLRVAREFSFAPTVVGGEEAYKIADELARAKVPVILGPLQTEGVRGPESTEIIRNQAGALHRAGVTLALSGGNLLEQARFAARFGLPREKALEAVTVTPAKLLGIDKRVGTLAPGLDADLLALDGDPFEFTTRVAWVMADGRVHNTGN